MKRALAVAAAMVLTACLGPQADPSSFYLITPTASPAGTPVDARIGIGPISLSGYLDRSEVATRVGENEITYAATDRWAEPLPDNVDRALRANLVRLLTPSEVVAWPWYEAQDVAYGIGVDVSRFDADSSGAVVLEASWRVSGPRLIEQLDAGAARITESVSGAGTEATVAAMSRALARLAEEIASAVRALDGR